MLRFVLVIISLAFWGFVVYAAIINKASGITAGSSVIAGHGEAVFYTSLCIIVLVGMWINNKLIDLLCGGSSAILSEGDLKVKAEKDARRELASGNFRLAAVHFQNAGELEKALEVAEQNHDHDLVAKISLKMGKKRKARMHYLKIHDFESAGNVSVLLGDIAEARESYAKAAKILKLEGESIELAAMLDRAGDRYDAAQVFEKLGAFDRAAESYEIVGERRRIKQLRQSVEAIKLYEKMKSGTGSTGKAFQRGVVQTPKDLEEAGDLYGAAWLYREAGNMEKAARCYEKFEEWERAAKLYQKLGKPDKVAELSMKIVPPDPSKLPPLPPVAAEADSPIPMPNYEGYDRRGDGIAKPPMMNASQLPGGKIPEGSVIQVVMPPSPQDFVPKQFVPLTQQPVKYIPVFMKGSGLSSGGVLGGDQNLDEEALKQLAQQFEGKGAFSEAAELYMRIGNVDSAMDCLSKGDRPLDAALRAIGVGDYVKAAEYLVAGLEKGGTDNEALGLLLGEMLIQLKDAELAERLFRKRLAPKIGPDNAVFVYRYARLFEDAGYFNQALLIYQELVDAGADSYDLDERIRALKIEMARLEAETGYYSPSDESKGVRKIDDQEDARGLALKFLDQPVDPGLFPDADDFDELDVEELSDIDVPSGEVSEIPREEPSVVTHDKPRESFVFRIPKHSPFLRGKKKKAGEDARESRDRGEIVDADHQVSLFAAPRVSKQITKTASTTQAEVSQAKQKGRQSGSQDLFSPTKRYEIVREIGKGGMGVVYEAMDSILGRRLALKVLTTVDASAENLKQFLLEARAIAQLTHPNVIMIFDVGVIEMRHYIAMEFIDGSDLKQYIRDNPEMSVKDALRVFIDTCEGLRAVHNAGIVHRDIKPANVLLTKEGRCKIVDFGLAKLEEKGKGAGSGETMFKSAGTPGYMPPEQLRGEDLVPACDIYALGITLFVMLTGKTPHKALNLRSPLDISMFTLEGQMPRISDYRPDVPEAIDHLFRYCTEKEIRSRYQSIDAFLPVAKQWYEAL